MSLTVEEIQKTLMESMMSFQNQMEIERKAYKEKIKKLEEKIEEKDEEIKLLSKKKSKDAAIRNFETENQRIKKELENKSNDYQRAMLDVSTLNNQIELKNQDIMQLKLEKKQIQEKLDEAVKQNDLYKKEMPLLQKQIEEDKNLLLKNKEDIEARDKTINELKEKIKNIEIENNKLIKDNEEMKIKSRKRKK